MAKKGLFSVSAFAKLSRTTPATLHHYDRIGLLSPNSRGGNNYRYYSSAQLSVINTIRTSQKLGMTLDEIRSLSKKRTPENVEAILRRQINDIDKRIAEWVAARNLSLTLQKCIRSCLNVDEDSVTVQNLPAQAIILGELNDYTGGRSDYDALFSFYEAIAERYPDADLNYPVWGVFSPERVKRGDWSGPDRFYFCNPAGYDRRPAGLYAVGYTRGGYGHAGAAYEKCLEYINANGFEICGDTYEEYPLNEFCVTEGSDFLIRVLIPVCEKEG